MKKCIVMNQDAPTGNTNCAMNSQSGQAANGLLEKPSQALNGAKEPSGQVKVRRRAEEYSMEITVFTEALRQGKVGVYGRKGNAETEHSREEPPRRAA